MMIDQLGEAVQRKVDQSSDHGWADWVERTKDEITIGEVERKPASRASVSGWSWRLVTMILSFWPRVVGELACRVSLFGGCYRDRIRSA
jgi:hypothetical protein